MSLESKIILLIAAVEANTAAIMGNVAPTATTPAAAPVTIPATAPAPAGAAPLTPAPTPAAPLSQAPAATPAAPTGLPAAPATPLAAAPAAAASPSNPAMAAAPLAITMDQLKQEVTAAYQTATPEKQGQIGAIIQQYGASLTEIQPANFPAVIAAVRALP